MLCFREQESAVPSSQEACIAQLCLEQSYILNTAFFVVLFLLSSVPKIVLWAKIQFKDSKWQTHLGNRLMKQLLSFSHRPGFFCFAQGSKGKLVY